MTIETPNELIVLEDKLNAIATTADYSVVSSPEFIDQYASLVAYSKYLEDLKKKVDTNIKSILETEYFNSGNQSIEDELCKITFVPGSLKESFDTKRFKEENPDLYKKYIKVSSTAASLRTTLRDKESSDGSNK